MSCCETIQELFADRDWCVQIEIDMAAAAQLPALWSAEEPNLYVLVISVVTTDGVHLDSESVQVSFSSPAATSVLYHIADTAADPAGLPAGLLTLLLTTSPEY